MLDESTIRRHSDLKTIIKDQAANFLTVDRTIPNLSAIFGTQQRYLLAQLAICMVFESAGRGILLTHYLDAVQHHSIASHNTAQAFVQQMLDSGIAVLGQSRTDRRVRPLLLGRAAIDALERWMSIHLASLDKIDGGLRAAIFDDNRRLLEFVHPRLARGILSLKTTVEPKGAVSLFAWMNDGSLLMDKMMVSLLEDGSHPERIPTAIYALSDLSGGLRVTHTHVGRKILEAEAAGYVGWHGKRCASQFWISRCLIDGYEHYQVEKLASIEVAWVKIGSFPPDPIVPEMFSETSLT